MSAFTHICKYFGSPNTKSKFQVGRNHCSYKLYNSIPPRNFKVKDVCTGMLRSLLLKTMYAFWKEFSLRKVCTKRMSCYGLKYSTNSKNYWVYDFIQRLLRCVGCKAPFVYTYDPSI